MTTSLKFMQQLLSVSADDTVTSRFTLTTAVRQVQQSTTIKLHCSIARQLKNKKILNQSLNEPVRSTSANSLAILSIQISHSQGSVIMTLRWGWNFGNGYILKNLTVKEFWKFVNFSLSHNERITWISFITQCISKKNQQIWKIYAPKSLIRSNRLGLMLPCYLIEIRMKD